MLCLTCISWDLACCMIRNLNCHVEELGRTQFMDYRIDESFQSPRHVFPLCFLGFGIFFRFLLYKRRFSICFVSLILCVFYFPPWWSFVHSSCQKKVAKVIIKKNQFLFSINQIPKIHTRIIIEFKPNHFTWKWLYNIFDNLACSNDNMLAVSFYLEFNNKSLTCIWCIIYFL